MITLGPGGRSHAAAPRGRLYNPMPHLMRAMATVLFISPSVREAARLSALKELSSRAKNRFKTWRAEVRGA